jgi:hypothetical protein
MKTFIELTLLTAIFILVSILTWASGPIQKMNEKVQHKETVKATVAVCDRIRAMQDPYNAKIEKTWVSGCLYSLKTGLESVHKKDPNYKKFLDQTFKNQEGPDWDAFMNFCGIAAQDYREHEGMVDDLFSSMNCYDAYNEAEKLHLLDNKDVQ